MQRLRFLLLWFLFAKASLAQIVLSEIMFNPAGNERYDEFVELYNSGESPVDLLGWRLSDGTKFNTILPFEKSSRLLPGQFAIIFVPNYFQHSCSYDKEIPAEALIFTIDRSQFGAYGLKNSEGEVVSIHSPDTTVVAAFQYTPDNEDGFSEEKIECDMGDEIGNWANSTRFNGTPGYENSVTPKNHDLALNAIFCRPVKPCNKDSIVLVLGIKNIGKQRAEKFKIIVKDSTAEGVCRLYENNVQLYLAPLDSAQIICAITPLNPGDHSICASLVFEQDERLNNNHARINIKIARTFPQHCVIINEIMYDTDEKYDEWIELFNTSEMSVDLQNWSIRDKRKSVELTSDLFILKPGDYCVLANHDLPEFGPIPKLLCNLPELNNSGDEVVLLDASGSLIDSVSYDQSFGGDRYVSLERIRHEGESADAANWKSCRVDTGCTPGFLNSVSPKDYDAAIQGVLHPTPAKPIGGDDVDLSITIQNSGRSAIQDIRVKITGHAISDSNIFSIGEALLDDLSVGQIRVAHVFWPNVPPGVFVIRSQLDMNGDMLPLNNSRCDTINIGYAPDSIVINEIMYSPAVDLCEWIELFNNSTFPVELMDWRISDSDSSHSVSLAHSSMLLLPGDFAVIGSDSLSYLPSGLVYICPRLSSLNNDQDAVFIFDACGYVVDHVHYNSTWGGATGRSLERIQPGAASSEGTNWTTSVDAEGHTAGAQNSVYIKAVPQETSLAVSPDIFSPDGDGLDDFVGISYSLPGRLAQVNIKIFDIKGRLVRFLLNNAASGAQRTVFWDGLNDAGRKCRMGIYIIFFEALNQNQMCINRATTTVVLAGAL